MRSLSLRAELTAGAAHGCQSRDADLHPGAVRRGKRSPPRPASASGFRTTAVRAIRGLQIPLQVPFAKEPP